MDEGMPSEVALVCFFGVGGVFWARTDRVAMVCFVLMSV